MTWLILAVTAAAVIWFVRARRRPTVNELIRARRVDRYERARDRGYEPGVSLRRLDDRYRS